MKLYEYVLRLKDEFSDKMKRFSSHTEQGIGKLKRMNKEVSESSNLFSGLGRKIATVFAVGAIMAFGNEILTTTARMDGLKNTINFASGGMVEGAKNIKFLEETADRLGLPLEAATGGFRTLSAAMMGSKLQGEATRKIFEGVSIGAAAMNLTSEQAEGAFLALGQMMSKGKVSAEELRGQLGERIPGAFQIAARAMGMSTAELDKMMSKGQIMSEDFLPKFAEEMRKTYSGALPVATQSLTANMNRMNNQILLTKTFIGDKLRPVMMGGVKAFTQLAYWVRENWGLIANLATIIGIGTGVFLIYKTVVIATTLVTAAYTTAVNFARLATVLFTGGFGKLNMVMKMNPIGLVLAGLAALALAFIYMYNKVEWFRGGVWGLWESFKEVFMSIADVAKNVFGGVWDMIEGLLDMDTSKMKAGFEKFGKGMLGATPVGFASQYGEKIAKKFKEGYANGVKKGPIGLPDFLTGGDGALSMNGDSAIPENPKTTDGINSIAGGGSKQMHIEINFKNFVDRMENHYASFDEGLDDMEKKFKEMFARIVNGGIYATNQ